MNIKSVRELSMLWSLFEARILNNSGNANRICATVASWREPARSASALRKCVVCSASVPIGRYGTCVYVGTRCREPSKSIGWWGTTIAESAHEDPNFDISVPSPRVRAIVLDLLTVALGTQSASARVWRATSPPSASFVHAPLQRRTHASVSEQRCANPTSRSGRRTHSADTNSWRIAPSICWDLISDRNRGRPEVLDHR